MFVAIFLRSVTPALFLALLAWSCCLLDDPSLNIVWLYHDVLRFSTLPQGMRNNELLDSLHSVYVRDADGDDFRQLSIHGWPVCDSCYQILTLFQLLHG